MKDEGKEDEEEGDNVVREGDIDGELGVLREDCFGDGVEEEDERDGVEDGIGKEKSWRRGCSDHDG
ncbi:hypothetical protein [Paenibacillus xylanexedens]|uniref:hypothetical protein n=1 Tax=Paenibacillus xylanexedens TaxID=528191 RepID=UPI00119CE14B|nr:hypothetical protein [Paenibacillus xylanexedens]